MYTQNLFIVSADKTFSLIVKEALGRCFDNVSIVEEGLPQGSSGDLALAFIQDQNDPMVKELSDAMPVMAFVSGQDANQDDIDETLFEKVVTMPLRLGKVVDYVCDVIEQQERRKTLAPISFGKSVTLDPRTLFILNEETDHKVRLTEKEADILLFLSNHLNKPVARQTLLDEVWGYASTIETHTLETHIYRLRQKLKNQLGLDDFLITKDDGYILNF